MFYSIEEVLRDYERDRDNAAYVAEKRKTEIYKKIPRVQQIDMYLNTKGASLARVNPEKMEEAIKNYKEETAVLLAERDCLIKKARFPKNYETDVYKCKICLDTGYKQNNEKCSCFHTRLIKKNYSHSNLNEKTLEQQNFSSFDITFYSSKPDERTGLSPQENIKMIKDICTDWLNRFECSPESLFFYGNAGVGKTFMCNCLAKELLDKGKSVFYITAPALFKKADELRFARFDDDEPNERDIFKSLLLESDLLVIDDLGAEFHTHSSSAELFDIINTRELSGKPVVISSNMDTEKMKDDYTERVTSRIRGNYALMKFLGDDIRTIKKMRSI